MLVIGEKINGTLDLVREAIRDRDSGYLSDLAQSQFSAGADYVDINVGIGEGENEADSMEWAIGVVTDATDKPVSLDSSDAGVLAKGLGICGDSKPFVNSVSGEKPRLTAVLPLIAEHQCPVVALAMDESGIPESPSARLEVCRRIAEAARSFDIPDSLLYFDPLVMPISADSNQGRVTLQTLSLIKKELPEAGTVLGLSNVSFGLPCRSLLNRSLLNTAVYFGLDAVLMDPTDRELTAALFAAEAVSGRDRMCRNYIKAYRAGSFG